MNATVVRAGFLTSVQDLGRLGFRQFGVSVGGALDSHALRVANLLVGNDEIAAGVEITFSGLQLRFTDDRIVAWCGGEFDVREVVRPICAQISADLMDACCVTAMFFHLQDSRGHRPRLQREFLRGARRMIG